VLLVEDNPDHARLIERRLAQLKPTPANVAHVGSFADAISALKAREFEVILLDLRLPDSGLDETLPRMTAAAPHLPIIVLTSLEEFDFAVELVKQGAQDYMVKSDIDAELLSRSIHYAIERKRIQRHLEHYAAELERTNRELDQFTRVVSHDLKSPLAVIQMELNAANRLCLESAPDFAEHIHGALQTANQMRGLIDDLLRYARTGEDDAAAEEVDCDDLLQRLLGELKPMIDDAQAEVTCDALPKIWGSPTRLAQLFQNLITNALKYRGDRSPRVHVSAEYLGPDWVFSVEDNGVGIAAEDCERIFDVFTRLHSGDEIPGTGVGLSICKRVVESHGGRIWADSEPGRGTTFYFNLPTQPPHSTHQAGGHAPSEHAARPGSESREGE
jgi:signal transduction histidine kinase